MKPHHAEATPPGPRIRSLRFFSAANVAARGRVRHHPAAPEDANEAEHAMPLRKSIGISYRMPSGRHGSFGQCAAATRWRRPAAAAPVLLGVPAVFAPLPAHAPEQRCRPRVRLANVASSSFSAAAIPRTWPSGSADGVAATRPAALSERGFVAARRFGFAVCSGAVDASGGGGGEVRAVTVSAAFGRPRSRLDAASGFSASPALSLMPRRVRTESRVRGLSAISDPEPRYSCLMRHQSTSIREIGDWSRVVGKMASRTFDQPVGAVPGRLSFTFA